MPIKKRKKIGKKVKNAQAKKYGKSAKISKDTTTYPGTNDNSECVVSRQQFIDSEDDMPLSSLKDVSSDNSETQQSNECAVSSQQSSEPEDDMSLSSLKDVSSDNSETQQSHGSSIPTFFDSLQTCATGDWHFMKGPCKVHLYKMVFFFFFKLYKP
ncbi:uncharacterized protein LOC106166949 [Lingula anatina]|uniref:Uncharacterized protein LOC106166949 n=1 Tax=Lingula anatina TaxID=7574 RepID=A0A1S3ISL7_LINAN|nr:uncharacterized protein LOC106166949 [Lingula anatina]|eukprot:XP_013401068.1 uncharacterized protein LOC106166949 [Lingula anatina]